MHFSSLAWLGLLATASGAPTVSQTVVKASTGYYSGNINKTYTNVREFLNVPYGQTTAGKNRWEPPKSVPLSNKAFDSTYYGAACPQYVSKIKNIYNQEVPAYLYSWGNSNWTAGESAVFTTEDCLSLAIWTPADATADSGLPVAMFMTGGGFQTNGILVPGQLPPHWVSRSQKHIVVTINYRMNIMGFPNAADLYDQNLGILDQRLAQEWVRDNIRYFGGDPERIMLWGQSAGASSVDIHNYAYYNDPIPHAFFAESGSVLAFPSSTAGDWTHSNFSFVAKSLGCDYPNNGKKELDCMKKVDYNDIINFMGQYQDNQTLVDPAQPAIAFSTVPDDRIVFSNYAERYQSGMVTNAPMLYSSCANEGAAFQPFPQPPSAGINQTSANLATEGILCGASNSSVLRDSVGLRTYRYQYAGNWSNQDPLNWMGAFHSSDLVMLMGAYTDSVGPASKFEAKTSATMGDFLYAFLSDPYNGPQAMGWPAFDTSAKNGGTMLRFGADGMAVQNVSANSVEGPCLGTGPYDPHP